MTTRPNPLAELSETADTVRVDELTFGIDWSLTPNPAERSHAGWEVDAQWIDYHGAQLSLVARATTIVGAAKSVLERKRAADAEFAERREA